MRKYKDKVKGFTLIELIVVIAIIGVIAAILVPVISSYVAKSKIASQNANAKQFYTNIASIIDELSNESYTINGISIGQGEIANIDNITLQPSYTGSDLQERFNKVPENFVVNQVNWAFYIRNNEIKSVICVDRTMNYAGGFPNPCPVKQKYRIDDSVKIEDLLTHALKSNDSIDGVGAEPWPAK